MTFKDFTGKMLNEMASLKCQLAFTATLLFALGKLSESGWITFVLSITGIRMVNEITGMAKDVIATKTALKNGESK